MTICRCTLNGCELKFPRDDARIHHESCHDNEQKKQFKCPHCNEKFSVWRMCSSHLWKSHNIDLGLLSCPKCKFKSASFGKLLIDTYIENMLYNFWLFRSFESAPCTSQRGASIYMSRMW